MRGKVHLAAGVCAGAAGAAAIVIGDSTLANALFAGQSTGIREAFLFTGFTALGSLFPDIDSPTSMLGRKFPLISTLLNSRYGHRGILHVPILYLIAGILVFCLLHPAGIAYASAVGFFYGVMIHILQDMMTRGGIMLFYPWKKRISLVPVRSGSLVNIPCTIVLVCLLAGVWLVW